MAKTVSTRDIVVIGTSAGGLEALRALTDGLERNIPASLFVVQHIAAGHEQHLAEILSKTGPLPASIAKDGERFLKGRIYIARADYHILFGDGRIVLGKGPRENHVRPAIDPLFRSAAATFGARVIGVLLSGTLDDGMDGLLDIKQAGGLVIVQDPKDARYPEMPKNALDIMEPDYLLPASGMGGALNRLVRENMRQTKKAASGAKERETAQKGEAPKEEGELTTFICPDCGGPLWEMDRGKFIKYRCEIGHSYGPKTLVKLQDENIENAAWAGVRALDERARMLERLARYEEEKGRMRSAAVYLNELKKIRGNAGLLRSVLVKKAPERKKK